MLRYLAIICLVLFGAASTSTEAQAQKTMTIQIREAQLRATPSHLGRITARAAYGDRVTVVEERGDWRRVSTPGKTSQGWLHATALTTKRIVLKAGQTKTASVSQDEIALAGKGFSEEVEAEYRKANRNLDYTWINRMEAIRVTPQQMQTFMTSGNLKGGTP
ncbi:MAG: SH3 domain-containing protein [Smithellaceae bacterium]